MNTITVTTTADSGAGSLRAAIAQAQAGDTIKFDSSLANQTITLTKGQLEINKDLIIDGGNAPGLTISGNKRSRIFLIQGNSFSDFLDISLRNLNITNGKTSGVDKELAGAGIWTASGTKLTVENSTFKNNHVQDYGGGAIFGGWRSTTVVINSTFEKNSALGNEDRGGGAITIDTESSLTVIGSEFIDNKSIRGGAINVPLGTLTVENSTFTNNQATLGGAIYNLLGGLNVENSTFFKNSTTGDGGAIFTDGASLKDDGQTSGTIEIRHSRFDRNTAVGGGGGLFLFVYDADKVILEDSTIINNQVTTSVNGFAAGGGVRQDRGEFIVRNTTFANNQVIALAEYPSLGQGGGLWVGDTERVTIDNSTFYGNRAEATNGKGGIGGAIRLSNDPYPTSITNTTIANNYTGFQGAGFWAEESANVTLVNTLLADNFGNNDGRDSKVNHHTNITFKDGGGNFQSIEPAPSDTKITPNVTFIDPKLGKFIDNGGMVQTPPLPSNPDVTAGAVISRPRATFPADPSDLIVTAISDTEIELTWADRSNNETGFKIERSRNQQNWTVVATTAADVTRYRDTDLTSNTQYYYRIRAINDVGDSAATFAQVTTDSITKPQPVPESPQPILEPTLSRTSEDVFWVEGDSDAVQLQFNLTGRDTDSVNEVGIFWVDDESGYINGIAPGETGYLEAALSQSQVVFSVLPGNQFPDLSLTRQFGVDGDQEFGFYLVKDSTTDTVRAELAAGGTPDNIFFGLTSANGDQFDPVQVSELGDDGYHLGWEDGNDGDFDDLVFTVQL
ncbi:MAG: right-handed parallel beta-helix repeat-containing protein, partial [Coleofasciculus sp.]